jgi:hypothetical protein
MGFYDNGTIYGIKIYSVDGISFRYYTECSSTYDEENFLMWFPISLDFFKKKFVV